MMMKSHWIERLPARENRVVLLSHQAAVHYDGRTTLMHLLQQGYRILSILTPEHGYEAAAQDHEPVASGCHGDIPVYSLYGEDLDSLKPKPEMVRGADFLLIDLVDIGCRYYTYAASTVYAIQASLAIGLPVYVVDRPNPIRGDIVQGPPRDDDVRSFVGELDVPVRHGMTMGELMLYALQGMEARDLHIIRMDEYDRHRWLDPTMDAWVPPSPNMPDPSTALLYPGTCLVEATNLSEGRGTAYPFHVVGAPFLNGVELARRLNAKKLPGVRFQAFSFRPSFQKWAGILCHGVCIEIVDRDVVEPFDMGIHILLECRAQAPDEFEWRSSAYEFEAKRPAIDMLTGSSRARSLIESGDDPGDYLARCRDEAVRFGESVSSLLLYPR